MYVSQQFPIKKNINDRKRTQALALTVAIKLRNGGR